MKPQIFTLENGLRVILVDTKAFPTLTTLLLVGAGSRYENKNNNGIAHFFEHMAFKGSKKYPNSFVISSTIEGLGGVFNAFTSKDHTGYWIKSTNEHFETVIDVLSDMVLHPLLLPEEINREKGVIVEEINMYEDMPQRRVGEIFENLLYPGNPLGFDIAGGKDGVRSFNRKTFTDYIASLYHPENAVLVVAGGLNINRAHIAGPVGSFPSVSAHLDNSSQDNSVKDEIDNNALYARKSSSALRADRILSTSDTRVHKQKSTDIAYYSNIIESKFDSWKKGVKGSFEKIQEKQSAPQSLIKYKKTEQAHFCLGFRAFSFFDKRKYALSVLSAVLGGGMSSRLFMQVRERRGLCYYISTGRELYHDCGNMVTQAGVTNNEEKVKEAVKVILEEHMKIAKGDLKQDELTKVKELLKGRLLLSLEDSSQVASFYGTKQILQGMIEDPEKAIEKIEKISVADVVSVAKQLFTPKNLNFVMIGPFEKNIVNASTLVLKH